MLLDLALMLTMPMACLQISWESLKPTIVRKIGNGSFGQVFEVYYHSAPMAIKIINIDGDATALPGALLRFKYAFCKGSQVCWSSYLGEDLGGN